MVLVGSCEAILDIRVKFIFRFDGGLIRKAALLARVARRFNEQVIELTELRLEFLMLCY